MNEEPIEYQAFRRAALSSEAHRIVVVLGILGALMVGLIVRNLSVSQLRLLFTQTLVLTLAVTFELFLLTIIKKALRDKRGVPRPIWFINLLIDAGLPTLGVFIMIESGFMDPHQALVAPAVFLYFLFIILSTLRLSPGDSLLTGLMSALGYIAACFHGYQRHPVPDTGPSIIPTIYFIYAGLIMAAGVAAAVVAGQIRNHVFGALREAELQREVSQFNHDLDIARSIQQGLLPSGSPVLSDFDICNRRFLRVGESRWRRVRTREA